MKGKIYILLGACSYGVLSSFVKLAYKDNYIVNDVVGIQMMLGALILWLIVLFTKNNKTDYEKITRKQIMLLMIVGSTTGLTGLFYYSALQYVSASLGIVLLFQFTWIGILLDTLLYRKPLTKTKIISIVVLLLGTTIASNVLSSNTSINPLGLMYGLLAALSYSIFILASGKIATKSNSITRSALMISGGLIACTILAFPTFYSSFDSLIKMAIDYGFYLAIFGPVISTIMFAKGTPIVGPGMASILGAMELPVAIIVSQIVLKEQVSLIQYVGILLILLAIAYPQISKKDK